ncbi:hypothetical protein PM082_016931 [Marasmius tenuissimus]|nr:hypothetical protein PM082_016931 [Marasmius tenuissimus]
MSVGPDIPEDFTQERILQVALLQAEKRLELLFAGLLKEQQKAYLALHNSHEHDGSGPLLGVLRTNSFGMILGGEIYSGVCKDASRLNHSCCPNTYRTFNPVTFAMEFRAMRNIDNGVELTTAYIDEAQSHQERQEQLDAYGFQCQCPSCKDPKASDARLAWYRERTPNHVDHMQQLLDWLMDPRCR